MSRYELSISMDYVSKWTYIEAIREIFQNALDEETVNKSNKMFIEYDKDSQVLRIGNKEGSLDKNSLLLGVSSKRDSKDTIGQHGEGYKVATVVLLREGLGLKVYNYKHKELWVAKKIKSRRYNMEIPVFDIDKYIFKSVPDHNLVFEIEGITEEMFNNAVNTNLHLKGVFGDGLGSVKKCSKGTVLLDEKFKGQVYVNGLYVRTVPYLTYGYDFIPELITLDRDRDLIESFDLKWSIGILLRDLNDIMFVKSMINTNDAEYLFSGSVWLDNNVKTEVANSIYKDYVAEHGEGTTPCTSSEIFNSLLKSGKKPVMVSDSVYCALKSSSHYGEEVVPVPTLNTLFREWYEKAKGYLPDDFVEESEELISRILLLL